MTDKEKILQALYSKDKYFAGFVNEENAGGMFGKQITITAITKLSKKEITDIVNQTSMESSIQITVFKQDIPDNQGLQQGDEVKTLFMGMLPTSAIVDNNSYKIENPDDTTNVKEWYREFRFLTPIILDRQLNVIDGHVRLEIAKKTSTEYVSVVVTDAEDIKSKALRLGLNRTSEFSRWDYNQVDPIVDSVPQLQPILEPIGFFSNNILPTSFFSSTVINYKKDPYNDQMKQYMQDGGLLKWADLMRKRNQSLEDIRAKRANDYSRHSGLLNIKYSDDDLLDFYNPEEVVNDSISSMVKIADRVTKNFDKERKPELEAKGQEWQHTKRTSRQKALDKRIAAENNASKQEDKED